MKRRGFLGLLGGAIAAPFLKNAVLADAPATTGSDVVPTYAPMPGRIYAADQPFTQYRYMQAQTQLRLGDIVCFVDGQPAGVAVSNMEKGDYGFMQVSNVAPVRMTGVD